MMEAHDGLQMKDKISMGMGKNIHDGLQFKANMHIQLFGPDGKLKDERHVHNVVTDGGKQGVADQILAAPTLAKMEWMAVGTGTPTGTGLTDKLGAEVGRVAFDSKTRGANSIITCVALFPAGTGTGALTEAGTFAVVTANTIPMWMSATFLVVNKAAGDSLVITWTLTIA